MTRNYEIATINICLKSSDDYFFNLLGDYETSSTDVDMYVDATVKDYIDVVGDKFLERDSMIATHDGDIVRAYYYHDGKMYGAIAYDDKYVNCKLTLIRDAKMYGMNWQDIAYLLLGTLFNYNLTYHNGITLHGSAIKYDNKAIIFTAPSGVGKSTQANLWQDVFGDKVSIINDDKPSLIISDNSVMCYGTPFAGKHHININDSAPLGVIINVVRGDTNMIERLSVRESVVLLLEETTRSMLSQKININNMNIISDIISKVPIFRLYCTIDKEAVAVTYDAIREVL